MSYELYLHIGYPKTGTTFLQRAVFPSAQSINFIKSSSIGNELSMITHQCHLNFDAKTTKLSIEQHFKSGRNLISNEALIGDFHRLKLMNSKIVADRLKMMFPGARIIVTVRNQYDLMESLYKQYLQRGGVKRFRDFVNYRNGDFGPTHPKWNLSVDIAMFNFLRLLEYYESLFGRENLFVVPYELLQADPKGFSQMLFSWMGLDEAPSFKNEFYNTGYGAAQVSLARIFNRFLRSELNEGALIPDVSLPVIGKIDAGRFRSVLQSSLSRKLLGKKPITDLDMKKRVHDFFAQTNRKMNDRYSLGLDQHCPGKYF